MPANPLLIWPKTRLSTEEIMRRAYERARELWSVFFTDRDLGKKFLRSCVPAAWRGTARGSLPARYFDEEWLREIGAKAGSRLP